jgi:hypothetical protein
MKISIILEANTGKFETDLKRASKSADKEFQKMVASAKKWGAAIGAALVTGVTVLGVAVKQAIDRADAAFMMAQRIGTTTEAITRLGYAAQQSDVSMEGLQIAFVKLARTQTAALEGNKEAVALFKAFGMSAEEAGKDLEVTFRKFAEGFSRMEAGPEKLAIATRVFGKSAAELIPLLNLGEEGLRAMADEADRLGITIDSETAAKAEAFNDQLSKLKSTLDGVALDLAGQLLPLLSELVAQLQAAAEKGELARNIASAFETVATAVKLVAAPIQLVIDLVQSLTSVALSLFNGLRGALSAFMLDVDGARQYFRIAKEEAGQAGSAWGTDTVLKKKNQPAGVGKLGGAIVAGVLGGANADPAANAQSAAMKEYVDRLRAEKEETARATAAKQAASAARQAHAAALREEAAAERERARAQEEAEEASREFQTRLEDLQDELAGPLAQANREFAREQEALKELWKNGATPAAEDLEQALSALAAAHAKNAEEIRKSLDPAEERLKQMRAELEIMNLQTQAERDAAEFMMQNPGATADQAKEAAAILAEGDAMQKAIALNQELKQSFADNFAAFVTGAKSAKEAAEDFLGSVVSMLVQIAAQKLALSIFGDGAGMFGGLSGFFATGTSFAPGGLAMVGERGPELVHLPKGSKVTPNYMVQRMGGKATNNNFNINVDGNVSRETAQQLSLRLASAVTFAQRAA